MSTITATEVNNLRKMTGAGLMACKKALQETNGDVEAAIDVLRKTGQKLATKRADREANEGVIVAKTSEDGKKGIIVNLSCETDFVAKNDDFVKAANELADIALNNDISDLNQFLEADYNGTSIKLAVEEMVGKIGEKIEVSNFERVEDEQVVPYIHAGNKIGVLVAMNKNGSEDIIQMGRDVAMQIAAMSPVAVDETEVSQETIDRELAIGREIAIAEGKPENIIENIAKGKLKRFFKDNTLIHQPFVKDGSKTVAEVLKSTDPDLKINAFKRVALGN